jgi:hypothetical protein
MFRMRISALRCDICAALQPSGTSQAGNWQSLLWSEALQVLMKPAKKRVSAVAETTGGPLQGTARIGSRCEVLMKPAKNGWADRCKEHLVLHGRLHV